VQGSLALKTRERMVDCHNRALKLLEEAEGADPEQRALVQHKLDRMVAVVTQMNQELSGYVVQAEETLAEHERLWNLHASKEKPAEGKTDSRVGLCRKPLALCTTSQQQRPWLLRAASISSLASALKRTATLSCRACAKPASAAADKLKRCGRASCGRVAYCGAACQRADWPRHERWCSDEHADCAEALLADALCTVCCRPLLGSSDAASGDPRAALVLLQQCSHFAHVGCVSGARCAACF
jgi:hypothetical protein